MSAKEVWDGEMKIRQDFNAQFGFMGFFISLVLQ